MRRTPYACPSAEQLADLLAAAFLEQLEARARPVSVALRPVGERVRLDDTGRPPYVALRPAGGDRE